MAMVAVKTTRKISTTPHTGGARGAASVKRPLQHSRGRAANYTACTSTITTTPSAMSRDRPLLDFGPVPSIPPPSYAAAHDDEEEKDAPPRRWYHFLPSCGMSQTRVVARFPPG